MLQGWITIVLLVGLSKDTLGWMDFKTEQICKETARITNGDVDPYYDEFLHIYKIRRNKFHCKAGYHMNLKLKLNHRLTFECGKETGGIWQGYKFGIPLKGFGLKDVICQERTQRCPKPIGHLLDGKYKVTKRFCKTISGVSSCFGKFYNNDEITYSCNKGYQMKPVKVVKTINVKKECEDKNDKNDYEDDYGGDYGGNYDGYDGYNYDDDDDDDDECEEVVQEHVEIFEPKNSTFTCSRNGAWTNGQDNRFPECERITCNGSRFENISNGYVKNFTDLYIDGQLDFGDVLELVCDRGYKPIENKLHLGCFDSKKFDEEEKYGCERIRCPLIADPIGGKAYYPTQKRYVDDVVIYSCRGWRPKLLGPKKVTCLENGEWSSDRCARCVPKDADCPPPCMHEGNMLRTAYPTFKHGSVIELTCSDDQNITHNRTCMGSNVWDNSDLYCNGQTDLVQIMSTADALKGAMSSISESGNITLGEEIVVEGKSINEKQLPGGVELYLALDVSGSISHDEFALLKNFTLELVNQLDISVEYDGTRLCVYCFASKTAILYNGHWDNMDNRVKHWRSTEEAYAYLDDLLDQEAIQSKKFEKDDISFSIGEGTNIKALIRDISDSVDTKKELEKYHKRPAQQVVVVISDGEFNTDGNPAEKAAELRDQQVEIYSIYVGKGSSSAKQGKETMKSLNSSIPNEQHYFEINSGDLDLVLSKMVNRTVTACGLVDPSKKHITEESSTAKKEPADPHAWPWMVQFKDVRCGGSLIDRSHILTAAHCFFDIYGNKKPRQKYTFFFKSHKLLYQDDSTNIESQEVDVNTNIKIHEKFDMKAAPKYLYDIAIVTLPKPVTYDTSQMLRSVCLPEDENMFDDIISGKTPGIVTGWGELRNGKDPKDLMQVQMIIPKESECIKNKTAKQKKFYNSTFMFCAGGEHEGDQVDSCVGDSGGPYVIEDAGKENRFYQIDEGDQVDSCVGDSGGPYVIEDPGKENRFYQIGIVSSGFPKNDDNDPKCYRDGTYGLYTKLNNELLGWIRNAIKDDEEKINKK